MDAANPQAVAGFAEALAARADEAGTDSLTPPEQAIVRAWSAAGILGNGGFRYFYEGATDMAAVADAFEVLALPQAAQVCRQSMTFFPAHVLAAGHE
jgi:hypothetical protein